MCLNAYLAPLAAVRALDPLLQNLGPQRHSGLRLHIHGRLCMLPSTRLSAAQAACRGCKNVRQITCVPRAVRHGEGPSQGSL